MIGKLVQQTSDYQAFIPNDFPKALNYTPSTQTILATSQATFSIGKLDGLTQLVPNIDFFTLMYNRKEAALSSNIEGTQATMHDFLKAQAQIKENIPSDITDIHCYLRALKHGLQQLNKLPLASRLICEMHEQLMSESNNKNKKPGQFRRSQNWIGGTSPKNASFVPPPPSELNRCLKDLDNFMNRHIDPLPSLIKIALTHAQFETIHPFLDGNGRIGRLIITLQLCQNKLLEKPIFYISEYLRRYRRTYFEKLDSYRFGSIDDWVLFFLESTENVAQSVIASTKKLIVLQNKNQASISAMGRQTATANKLLQYLYQQPIINVAQAAKAIGLSRQATYGLIEKFENCKILRPMRPKVKRGIELMHEEYINIFLD